MTVRIEGAALVIRRERLDRRYPGGSAALIEEFEEDWCWPLSVDDDLVAIGLDDIRGNDAFLQCFAEYGLLGRIGRVWQHLALVDEEWGPTGECDWLDFVRLEDESLAWMPPRIT